jgi:toxin-antitoxin system PIN domain toxin
MKPCLVDINVWVAWAHRRHVDHIVAMSWFERAAPEEAGWNRFIQLGVMRLLSNSAVMSDAALPAQAAWRTIQEMTRDERVEMVGEPAGFEQHFLALLHFPYPTNKLIADAYLAAVAIGSSRQLVTFDKGFRQFKGLDLLLLGS